MKTFLFISVLFTTICPTQSWAGQAIDSPGVLGVGIWQQGKIVGPVSYDKCFTLVDQWSNQVTELFNHDEYFTTMEATCSSDAAQKNWWVDVTFRAEPLYAKFIPGFNAAVAQAKKVVINGQKMVFATLKEADEVTKFKLWDYTNPNNPVLVTSYVSPVATYHSFNPIDFKQQQDFMMILNGDATSLFNRLLATLPVTYFENVVSPKLVAPNVVMVQRTYTYALVNPDGSPLKVTLTGWNYVRDCRTGSCTLPISVRTPPASWPRIAGSSR